MADDRPDPPKADALATLLRAIERDDVPKIYANGFGITLSNSDISVVFQRFGQNPVAVVNLSYTLAKTLALRLGTVVAEFEAAIGQKMLTTERIDAAFKDFEAKSASEPDPASPKDETRDVH